MRVSPARNGRTFEGSPGAAARSADLFFEEMTGVTPRRSPRPAERSTAIPQPPSPLPPASEAWARRVFNQIAHTAPITPGAPAPDLIAGAIDDTRWSVVARPRSATRETALRAGHLVVRRALGEGRLTTLLALGASVDVPHLYGPDGLIRPDTLVIHTATLPHCTHGPEGRTVPTEVRA